MKVDPILMDIIRKGNINFFGHFMRDDQHIASSKNNNDDGSGRREKGTRGFFGSEIIRHGLELQKDYSRW